MSDAAEFSTDASASASVSYHRNFFRPGPHVLLGLVHLMHQMWTIVNYDAGSLSVARLHATRLCCANTAERIRVLLGMETLGEPSTSAASSDY